MKLESIPSVMQPAGSSFITKRRRRHAALVAFVLAALALPHSANAVSGPAPASQQRRVLSGVHTDAISVFAENGGLTLRTKADVDGNLGVQLDPNLTLFNVEESTRTTVSAAPSYAFLGTPGSDVWIAPESNPSGTVLWPGFSTEGVPTGVVDGNQLVLRLESVSGPGTLHIFQSDVFGEPIRRFSSTGTVHQSWTIPRGTHAHANWAFSAPGAYTLKFSASAMTNGVSVTSTQAYAFVVGNVPAPVFTTTTLAANTNAATQGDSVDLTATVMPSGAVGWVEFVDGTTVLGHDAVTAGAAALSTTNLALGSRSVTARFVPQWLNDFAASTSAPVVVTNTEPGGVPFGITGVAASYLPGDTLTATAVGLTLQAGQKYRWHWRVSGATEFELGDVTLDPVFSRELSVSDHGYELAVSVWRCEEWDEFCNFDPVKIAESGWYSVNVSSIGAPIIAQLTTPTNTFAGDEAVFALSGRVLGEGETVQIVRRHIVTGWHGWSSDELFAHEGNAMRVYLQSSGEYAVRVLNSEGVAVAQSAPTAITVREYEVQIASVQGVYRPGATLHAQGVVYPESTNALYQWSMFVPGGANYGILKEGYGPDALTLEIPDLTLAHDRGVLFLVVSVPVGPPFVEEASFMQVGQRNVRVYVQNIDPGVQIFQFQPLSDHYHQGNPINLVLAADPPPAQGDQIVWEWKWPGTDWASFPGAPGLSRTLTAEQALDGLQVRATFAFANTNTTVTAGPVTIFVDDHGAAARQQPTIAGAGSFGVGQQVTLTRQLPANVSTLLTTHLWERKAAGTTNFIALAGATNEQLAFTATIADDGAQYRVSILKPNGTVAYGPSPAVTLDVEPPTPVEFAIAGIAPSYLPGQTMNATVIGTNLQSGQNFRWQMRPIGSTGTGANVVSSSTSNTYARLVSAADNGYEIRVLLRSGSTILAQTAWVPITVGNLVEPFNLTWTAGFPAYMGDPLTASISGRALVEGETLRVVRRTTGTWSVPDRTTISNNIVTTEPLSGPFVGEWALQVVSNNVAVAQSTPIPVQWLKREINISGVQSVYRVGQTIQATATIYPPRDGIEFYWTLIDLTTFQSEDFPGGTDPLALTFERVVGLTNHNNQFSLVAFWTYPDGAGANIGQGNATINVTTADPSTQLFFFNSLGAHYHQGDLIGLKLIADPGLGQGDTITWEWKWPGAEWTTFPGASGLSNAIVAEQALEGVQVRATLAFGHTNITMVADPVTIHVDDHGAAPRQQPTIAGATSHTAGDTVTLTRQLPANGPTILTTHRWERKAAGATEFSPVAGASGATLSFPATTADDGAQYRVSIVKPGGQIAYGPSPAVTLTVGNAPTISDIANQFVTENTTSGAIAFTVGDVETAAGDLVVTATSSATSIVPNSNLVLAGSGANRTLTITPAANQAGPTTITVTVTDAGGLQSSDSFALTVVGNHVVPFALPAYYGGEVSTSVGSSASADLNGDGKVDLVYGAASQNTLRWAPGTGDGGFLPERGIGVGLNLGANAVTAVDYDGDGDIDVLTVELDSATQAGTASDGMVSLYRNDGTGQFTRSVLVATGLKQAPRLAVGDLNNDGRPDIVFGSTRPGSPVQQQDTFYALQLPSGDVGTPTKLADYLMELQIADVNGDGNADIVGGRFRTDFAYSIHYGDGTGNFATPQIITTGGAVGVFAVTDVTGDGWPDIVSTDTASGQRSLALYRQNADGTFAARVALPQNFTTAGTPPIRVADINQDGIPDLVTYGATGSVTAAFWLPGLGGGAFGPPVYLFPGAGGAAPVSRGLHVLDLDGDTYPDIVAVGPTSSSVPKPIAVFLNKTGEDPRVVSPPAARTRLAGELIEFKIYFGFPIAVTGTPRIALDLNGSTIYANYLSGSGTPTLTFRYTVGSNDLDLDGVQLAGTTIDLNGGTMTDPAGGAAALSFPATPFTGVFVNAFGPLVQSVTRLDQRTTTAGTVRFSVQFSESVTNVDAADFVLRTNDGDLAGATVQAVAGSGSLYEVTVSTGTGSGVLGLTVQGSSINGVSGASFSKTYVGGEVYTVRPQPIGTINTYYTHGHADYRPIYDNGEFDLVLHASAGVLPQTEYPGDEVITYLDSTSIVNRGPDSSFNFLGVAAGEPLYLSNASGSIATVPYLGFSGESLINVFTSSLTMQLVGMRSSSGGQFSLYSVGGLGGVTVRMATSDGITAADVLSLPVGAHGHFNTAFSKAGTYEVDIVASGYLDGNANGTYDAGVDQYVESGIQTLVFHVDTLGARNDSFTVNAGATLNGNVTMNDPWHAGIGAFTASVVTNTAHGTLTFNTDGSFSYVPNVGFFGTDSFVYRVTNERGGYTTATASIAVTDLALTVANGTATLTIATENGKTYQLETAVEVTGPWTDLGAPLTGTGQLMPVIVPLDGSARFFRWRVPGNP